MLLLLLEVSLITISCRFVNSLIVLPFLLSLLLTMMVVPPFLTKFVTMMVMIMITCNPVKEFYAE